MLSYLFKIKSSIYIYNYITIYIYIYNYIYIYIYSISEVLKSNFYAGGSVIILEGTPIERVLRFVIGLIFTVDYMSLGYFSNNEGKNHLRRRYCTTFIEFSKIRNMVVMYIGAFFRHTQRIRSVSLCVFWRKHDCHYTSICFYKFGYCSPRAGDCLHLISLIF